MLYKLKGNEYGLREILFPPKEGEGPLATVRTIAWTQSNGYRVTVLTLNPKGYKPATTRDIVNTVQCLTHLSAKADVIIDTAVKGIRETCPTVHDYDEWDRPFNGKDFWNLCAEWLGCPNEDSYTDDILGQIVAMLGQLKKEIREMR